MRNIYLIILCFLSIIIMSCKENTSEPSDTSTTDAIMPLKIGNTWTFRITYFDTLGNITNTEHKIVTISKDTLINNEHWFWSNSNWVLDDDYLYINRSDGLWEMRNRLGETPYLRIKYPAIVGDSWTVTKVGYSYDNTVLSTNTAVSTSLGSFTCNYYSSRYVSSTENYIESETYLSKNIGMIAWDHYYNANYRDFRLELLSYSLK